MSRRGLDPDRLAELEEQRRFLLRSLKDLEREHEAGDVDETDYVELRDGYTARAAAILREIEAGRAVLPPPPPPNWRRRGVIAFAVVALFAVVFWALTATNAQRLPGQTATGLDPRDQRQLLLAQARAVQLSAPAAAADLYTQVLVEFPDDVEALTYRGWTTALSATDDTALRAALADLSKAIELDPQYPDPWCFRGIVTFRILQRPELADGDLDQCLAFNPPADVRDLVEGMRATAPGTTAPE